MNEEEEAVSFIQDKAIKEDRLRVDNEMESLRLVREAQDRLKMEHLPTPRAHCARCAEITERADDTIKRWMEANDNQKVIINRLLEKLKEAGVL